MLAGWQALLTVIVLTLLEVTFSADNAVVNSKIITTLSPLWQKLFMTLGIFIAVFVVRFAMPIVIVAVSSGLGFTDVVNLALNSPLEYEHHLSQAEPVINAFGGAFLIMIALSYFIDFEKQTHWLKFLESRLGKLGKFNDLTVFIMLLASIILYFTVAPNHQSIVLIASICAMTLHIGLALLNEAFDKKPQQRYSNQAKNWHGCVCGFYVSRAARCVVFARRRCGCLCANQQRTAYYGRTGRGRCVGSRHDYSFGKNEDA